jgi:predicted transcriptional regulator
MKAVVRGEPPAPADAARMSFNSTEALVRLLTPGNRALLALTRDRKPNSVAALAKLSGRAQPNLARTIAKLEAAGLVAVVTAGRKRGLRAIVSKLASRSIPTRIATRWKSPKPRRAPAAARAE